MKSFASGRISSCSHDALETGHVFLPALSLEEKLHAFTEHYCSSELKMDDIYIYIVVV